MLQLYYNYIVMVELSIMITIAIILLQRPHNKVEDTCNCLMIPELAMATNFKSAFFTLSIQFSL